MEEDIKNLEETFNKDFSGVSTLEEIELLKVKYLGRKSLLTRLFSCVPSFTPEEKGVWGKKLNILKNKITSLLEDKLKGIEREEEIIDLTYPSLPIQKGSRHILSLVSEEICSIFENLGFVVLQGGEIEDEYHNFSALNIPLEHPSRDVFDTFYLDIPAAAAGKKDKGKFLLRSHTSPFQIRFMEKNKPPLAIISPGRVYRPDQVDASHSFMFHQIEGFVVNKGISFAHLKGVLLCFARKFFSEDVQLRFRPHFFPFTEPSAEVDVSCIICKGQTADRRLKTEDCGQKITEDKHQKCSVCKGKGWLEVLGCGMIHPNVLEACGIDFKKYKGFAFGMGVDRLAMLKYRIDDIRLLYDNDVRFLEQFG